MRSSAGDGTVFSAVSRLQSMDVEISPFSVPKRVYPTIIPAVFLTEPIKNEVHVPEDTDPDFLTQ